MPVFLSAARPAPARALALAYVLAALVPGAGALAQQPAGPAATGVTGAEPPTLADTVVTATRVPQPLAALVADVSVIDHDTIAQAGATGVTDLLARLPGVEIARTGGQGNASSVFLRGADSRFTAVYVDGVRVDSQSTGGAVWEQIPLSQIERIEVLRGPAAAVYGSDAVGGVIQLFTKRGEGRFTPYAGAGAGSHRTARVEAGFSGQAAGEHAVDYALGVARDHARGFNSRPTAGQNPDRDGYDRASLNARLGLAIDARQRLEASLLATNLDSRYDSATRPLVDEWNHHQLRTAGLAYVGQWSDAWTTRVQAGESRSTYATAPSPYRTETQLRNLLLQNELRRGPHLVTAAFERREDALQNAPIDRDRHQNALALGYGLATGAHTLQLNARRDDDSEFGGKTTGSAAYGFAFASQWRATVSAGTAFRVPTLYQRFSAYGQAGLQPESSHNAEAGVRWAAGGSSASATAYRNRITNLINYVGGPGGCTSPYGCYANVGRAVLEGVTFAAAHRVGTVALRGSLDFQNPRDVASEHLLARRARRHGTLGADTAVAGWLVGAEAQFSGMRYDDAANTRRLAGYGIVNLHASRQIAAGTTIVARLDNVGGRAYQLASGYATGGRVAYLGVRWQPQ